jgi:hypothetical protein
MKSRIVAAVCLFLLGAIVVIPYFPHREALERYATQGKVVTAVVTEREVKKGRKSSTRSLCFRFPRDGKQALACTEEYIEEADYARLPPGTSVEIIYLPNTDRSPALKSSVDERLASPPYGQFALGALFALSGVAALLWRKKTSVPAVATTA